MRNERVLQTGVCFQTTDKAHQEIYDLAVKKAQENIFDFGGTKVMIEGSDMYRGVWIETQPMGGEIYAAYDAGVALGNQLIFMRNARADGRLPGAIFFENGALRCRYDMLQGYCFPQHALDLYYWTNGDEQYLKELYAVLRAHDEYLWKWRDPAGRGCLQSWCVWDTGEDNSVRFGRAQDSWEGETPPDFERMPFYSMDVMGYSFDGRNTLAEISRLLQNGEEALWRERAEYVARRLREFLWREERNACFDRDKTGAFTDTLVHNNLRCMYHGAFSADMAARFVREHLLNPKEFYTPFPLPSIAANDPSFRNLGENNWSGQPQSLTYQRALFALEKYGYLSLAAEFAGKYLRVIKEYKVFVQQFDPFLAKPTMASHDGYGPAVLNVLAFTSHFYGVFKRRNSMVWTGSEGEYSFEQRVGGRRYLLVAKEGQMAGFLDGEEIFRARTGVRVITDEEGRVLSLVGLDGGDVCLTKNGHIVFAGELTKDGAVQIMSAQ